jgi:hypothetical protein
MNQNLLLSKIKNTYFERKEIKLRDRITELSRHIAVIKRMFPNNP